MNDKPTKHCARCTEPTTNGPWRGGRTFCPPCREALRDEFSGYRRYALSILGLALLVLSAACGGAVEPQVGTPVEACGYVEALPDGGSEVRFNDTDAWAFAIVPSDEPSGYSLILQGDAEALTIAQADAVGACLAELEREGKFHGGISL
jgi:hypothetical protein